MFFTQRSEVTRFNLVCHGLMLFWHQNDEIHILVPDETDHDFMIGVPNPDLSTLEPLPTGRLNLQGVTAGNMNSSQIAGLISLPVLHGSHLQRTNNERTEITIPAPHSVRAFCCAETRPLDMRHGTPPHVIERIPELAATVVVFSWFGPGDGRELQITSTTGETFKPAVEGRVANLCVYAQEPPNGKPAPGHGDKFNQLMTIVSTGAHPSLDVTSRDLFPDPPPEGTGQGVGLLKRHLLALARFSNLRTDGTGCVGGYVGAP